MVAKNLKHKVEKPDITKVPPKINSENSKPQHGCELCVGNIS